MKAILALLVFSIFFPLYAAAPEKQVPSKPMKVFVEIDGALYEVIIAKRDSEVPDRAGSATQERFEKEARKYGVAYLQERLVLRQKK